MPQGVHSNDRCTQRSIISTARSLVSRLLPRRSHEHGDRSICFDQADVLPIVLRIAFSGSARISTSDNSTIHSITNGVAWIFSFSFSSLWSDGLDGLRFATPRVSLRSRHNRLISQAAERSLIVPPDKTFLQLHSSLGRHGPAG